MNISILGTRGIPAKHGGFETFAEQLSLYLSGRGHQVTVYCQVDQSGPTIEDEWRGIRRVMIFGRNSAVGTIAFDWAAMRHALGEPGLILTLGYNTAIFSVFYRLQGRTSLMNMDGIEWRRDKWSMAQKVWLRLNEFAGATLSTHLIADHPQINLHLQQIVAKKKITTIAYGAHAVFSADQNILREYGLEANEYCLVIARPEPENSILEMVSAFSSKRRGRKLVVLGKYYSEVLYHRQVIEAASDEVVFLGAIYQQEIVIALRLFARVYLHGHRVGGTNPSLVEALAVGNPVLAHRNPFNEWVAGPNAIYFQSSEDLSLLLGSLLDDVEGLAHMKAASRIRHAESFTLNGILSSYEQLLLNFVTRTSAATFSGADGLLERKRDSAR